MKKSKLVTTIGMLCLSAAFLASCSGYVKSKGETVLIFNGKKYSALELFNGQKTPAAAEAKFNAVYRVAVRNYFEKDTSEVKALKEEVKRETQVKIAGQKSTASSNADKNGTSYDTEWQKILDSNKVDDEQGLYDKFEYEIQKEKFEEQFYKDKLDTLRDGGKLYEGKEVKGYLSKRQPYHVKQILIKIAGGKDKDYTNAQITEEEALLLNKVITSLAEGTPFSDVAKLYSQDTATASKGGDLGIMDRDTSFVNDFKLGLYLYESYFGSSTDGKASTEDVKTYNSKNARNELELNKDIDPTKTEPSTATDYANKIAQLDDGSANTEDTGGEGLGTIGLGQIPYEAALMLGKGNVTVAGDDGSSEQTKKGYADITFSTQHFSMVPNVTDNANYYPRNVMFNKYFNRHNVMVITPSRVNQTSTLTSNWESQESTNIKRISDDTYKPTSAEYYKSKKGFKEETKKNNESVRGYSNVLRDEKGRVILVFRSGNGSGEGSYQGIHFVVVERSPFIGNEYDTNDTKHKDEATTLNDYYTYYYPGQETGSTEKKHPTYKDGTTNKPTFVSYFANMEKQDLATRANDVKTKIKGYNPNLNTTIYQYLLKDGSIQFTKDAEETYHIKSTIDQWIEMKEYSTEYDANKTWNENWRDYYRELSFQKEKRTPQDVDPTGGVNLKYGVVTETCAKLYAELDGQTDSAKIEKLFKNGGVFHE